MGKTVKVGSRLLEHSCRKSLETVVSADNNSDNGLSPSLNGKLSIQLNHHFRIIMLSRRIFCWFCSNVCSLSICPSPCVYSQALLGISQSIYASINHTTCEQDKSPDTLLIYSFISTAGWFYIYGITDYHAALSSIMVDPVCWVGLLSDWIMIRWATIRDIDKQWSILLSNVNLQLCLHVSRPPYEP